MVVVVVVVIVPVVTVVAVHILQLSGSQIEISFFWDHCNVLLELSIIPPLKTLKEQFFREVNYVEVKFVDGTLISIFVEHS